MNEPEVFALVILAGIAVFAAGCYWKKPVVAFVGLYVAVIPVLMLSAIWLAARYPL